MTAPKFKWMVIHHIDRTGIWFKMTDGSGLCVFFWNPLRTLACIFGSDNWVVGWFPFHTKHIKGNW